MPNKKDGMLHGFLTWGLTSMVLLWALTSAIGGLVGGATSILGKTASIAGQGAKSAAPAISGIVQQATGVTPQDIQQQALLLLLAITWGQKGKRSLSARCRMLPA